MEAARVANLRGHSVILYEKETKLGGLIDVAAAAPYKDENIWIKEYYEEQMRTLNVQTELGKAVTAETIREVKPDVVILANGARWSIPDIPGKENNRTATSQEVLSMKVGIPDEVIVVRGASEGCEVAEFLLEMGKAVTIVEKRDELACDIEAMSRELLIKRIQNKMEDWLKPLLKKPLDPKRPAVRIILNAAIDSITSDGAVVVNNQMEKSHINGKLIVFTMARESNEGLLREAEEIVPEVYAIGDCVKPGTIGDAIYQGSFVAREI